MVTLNWTKWSPEDGCIRAEGERFTWLVSPALTGSDWALFKIANDSPAGDLWKVGSFSNLIQAQAAAERAETG